MFCETFSMKQRVKVRTPDSELPGTTRVEKKYIPGCRMRPNYQRNGWPQIPCDGSRATRTTLRRLSLKGFYQPAHIRTDGNLTPVDSTGFIRRTLTRRQVFSLRVRTDGVVIIDPLRNDVVEMLLAEEQEFVQAFPLDALNKPFDSPVEIGRSDR